MLWPVFVPLLAIAIAAAYIALTSEQRAGVVYLTPRDWGSIERAEPVLTEATILGDQNAMAVEAFVEGPGGAIYGTSRDGRVVRFDDEGDVSTAGYTLPGRHPKDDLHTTCASGDPANEELCGRGLGLDYDPEGNRLFVCDASVGLVELRFDAANSSAVASTRLVTNKATNVKHQVAWNVTFCNSPVWVEEEKCVYFTDSSARWRRKEVFFLLLEAPNDGALLKWCEGTNQTTLLKTGLYFPNGMTRSHDKSSLIFNELAKYDIREFYLKGDRKGTLGMFRAGMPLLCDNIHKSSSGGYWVAGASRRPFIDEFLKSQPWLRNLLGAVLSQRNIARMLVVLSGMRGGVAAELDEKGKLLRFLDDPESVTRFTSDVFEHKGNLYIGSFMFFVPPYKVPLPRRHS